MTDTTNLALPYLEGAQAQKHVTVNESLARLDALVLLAVEDKDLTAPPGSPADGARYIPKATATGAWSGKENYVAHYVDGTWAFYTPREGFAAYVRDEDLIYLYNGSAWVTADAALGVALITGRTDDTSPDPTADYGLTYDASASALKKVRLDHIGGAGLHRDVSSNTTLDATHCGRTVRVDASSGAIAITLPTSPSTDDWVTVRKSDSSANRVTVKVGSTDMAWLSGQYDTVTFVYWASAWNALSWNIAPLSDLYTTSGTWTKPPLARSLAVICIGAGGGAGSGRRGAAASARFGGGGGSSGAIVLYLVNAAAMGATETVTIGAGGSGGAGASSDATNGNDGAAGGASSFGNHARAIGGNNGNGGSASAGAGGASRVSYTTYGAATAGGGSSASATATVGDRGIIGAGGGGGGISTGDVGFGGGAGGNGSLTNNTVANGGNGGAAGANAGTAGSDISSTTDQFGGGGGGGGGGNSAGVGGAGAVGGIPGGGGGGGGASLNGSASGAGGAGARGEVRVTTCF